MVSSGGLVCKIPYRCARLALRPSARASKCIISSIQVVDLRSLCQLETSYRNL